MIQPVHFQAETTWWEKSCELGNYALCAGGTVGAFVLTAGATGLAATASWVCVALAARKVFQIALGFIVYQASLISFIFPGSRPLLRRVKAAAIQDLISMGVRCEEVTLVKSGIRYAALAVYSREFSLQWHVKAFGNNGAFEGSVIPLCSGQTVDGDWFEFLVQIMKTSILNFVTNNSNMLLINGPGVGESGGWPTRYQMGAAFEAGLQYLEQTQSPTHIELHGYSLGAGMLSEAILQHDFSNALNRGIQYSMISDRSFSKLSVAVAEVAKKILGKGLLGYLGSSIVEGLFFLSGLELDGVAAAKKLTEDNIFHWIIQRTRQMDDEGSDGVISDRASLHYALGGKSELTRWYLMRSDIDHAHPLPDFTTNA